MNAPVKDALSTRAAPPREPLAPRAWGTVAAAAIFLVLALWIVSPVWSRFTTAYVGGGELEGWIWRYWWMKQLLAGAWEQRGLFYTIYVALISGSYPETGNVFDLQAMSVPLEAIFGAPAYYNVKVVLTLVLNGLCGYWLGRLMVRDWTASVLCGVAFGFGSYVLVEIDSGRIRQAAVFPLALYAMCLMRMTRAETSWREPLLAGAAFGLCTTMYLYYGMSALFLTVLWLVALAAPQGRWRWMVSGAVVLLIAAMYLDWSPRLVGLAIVVGTLATALWIVRRDGAPRGRQFAVAALVAVITSIPYATWYIQQLGNRQPLPEMTYFRNFPPLVDLMHPKTNVHTENDNLLNSLQRFKGDSNTWDFPFTKEYRRSAPVVFSLIILAGLLIFPRRPWLWVAVTLVGYFLVLGPYLKSGLTDEYVQEIFGIRLSDGIRMPQALFFKYVPFFARLFSPVRMSGLFVLGFGVLLAWSVATAFQRLKVSPRLRPLLLVLLAFPVLGQMARASQAPLSYTPLNVPDLYPWIAAQDIGGVLELPFREGDFVNYYQMFHGKRVLGGWGEGALPPGYPPQGQTAFLGRSARLADNPFLTFLRNINEGASGVARSPHYGREEVDLVRASGYRYAVLHERGCFIVAGAGGKRQYRFMQDVLGRLFGAPVRKSQEFVRERGADERPMNAAGLYPYEILVYDVGDVTPGERARLRDPAQDEPAAPPPPQDEWSAPGKTP
ncbi:MAG: hypothetical protein FJX76_04620 [Armatimonadetes bacterium]|nr:hypothetical protein [Armatimonadota bacterium]